MTVETFTHTFCTSAEWDRFGAIMTKTCGAPFTLQLEAHDRRAKPGTFYYAVDFTSIDDRDRARIAMRFVDKETAEPTPAVSMMRAARG